MKYKVKKGETLWSIWESRYKGKMSWTDFINEFKRLNEGRDPDKIYAGETINLPSIPGGFLVRIASENPTMFALGSFTLGGLFVIGILYLTKKLKL